MDLFDVAAKITLDSSQYEQGVQKASASSQTLFSAVKNLADAGLSSLAERSNTVGTALGRVSSVANGVQSAIQTVAHPIETLKQGFENIRNTAAPAFEALQHPIEATKGKIQELTTQFAQQQQKTVQNKAFLEQLKITYNETQESVAKLTEEYKKSVSETGTTSEKSKELKQKLSEAEQAASEAAEELEKYGDSAEKAGKKSDKSSEQTGKLSKALKAGFKGLAKGVGGSVIAAGGAIGKVLFDSVSKYADFEQLRDGTKKIFDEVDYSAIAADANNAYKTMGLSASQYLESINRVGSSFASTMGDQKGYETAKLGMQALADYASGTGASVDMLNEKYQMIARAPSQYLSIADQFSGILPQTTDDFLKQAQAAGFLGENYTKLTEVPVAEYQEAITKMLDKGVTAMGFAGNAQREAFGTLSGSINTTKAAWENLVVGLTDSEADLGQLASNLVEAGTAMVKNIVPAAKQALSSLSKTLPELASSVGESLVGLIGDFLPDLVSAAVSLVQNLVQAIVSNSGQIINAAISIINTLVEGLETMAPMVLTGAMQIIAQLATGLGEALPTLLPAVMNIIIQLAMALTDPGNLGAILQSAVTLMQGLADGILSALPLAIDTIPVLIQNLIDYIVQNAPQFYVAATEIMVKLAVGLLQAIPELLGKLPEIMDSVVNGLVELAPQLLEAGKSMAKAVWNGIKSLFGGKGKGESVDVASSFDFNTVQTEAQQTASNVSSALSGMNTTLDFSAATTSATTQFSTLGTSATTAKDEVVTAFTSMGTEASSAMATAASGSGADWSSITKGAQDAAKRAAAAFKNLPNQFRAIWEQIKAIYNEVPSYFTRVFTIAKENVVSVWSQIPVQIGATFTQLAIDATNWGSDFITNFDTGVKTAWASGLKATLDGILKYISEHFKHSHPKLGPLADDYTWMPDMMNLFISGIKQYTPKLHKTALEAFDFSEMMQYPDEDYTFSASSSNGNLTKHTVSVRNTTDAKIDTLISLLRAYLPQLSNQQIVLDDGTLVGAMLPQIDAELGQSYLYKLRGNA